MAAARMVICLAPAFAYVLQSDQAHAEAVFSKRRVSDCRRGALEEAFGALVATANWCYSPTPT
jgi:hypothetical protein